MIKAIEWKEDHLRIIDQTRLPLETVYLDLYSVKEVFDAIQKMQIRGAPAIGVIAAYGLYLAFKDIEDISSTRFFEMLNEKINYLNSARPTAVNLSWALQSIKFELDGIIDFNYETIKNKLLHYAKKIHQDDYERCEGIAINGQEILAKHSRILTHCNTGALATGGIGTAFGVIYKAHRTRKEVEVFATESRPVLQGARLTVWELENSNIPVTLICDSAAAWLLSQNKADVVIVGADRIAADGSTANKIGTYSLAILAKHHGIPFYIAAPLSTIDVEINEGKDIPVEYRNPDEIRKIFSKHPITLPEVNCWNPAFDVTPPGLITGIITEESVIYPPYESNIKNAITSNHIKVRGDLV